MMRRIPVRVCVVAVVGGVFLGCGGSTEPPLAVGAVRVVAATTGAEPDPDGYTVHVGGKSATVGPNDSVLVEAVPAGAQTVALTGLASNCSAAGDNPRTLMVTDASVARAAFAVTCSATGGTLHVVVTTTGRDPDPDGYTLSVDGAVGRALGVNETTDITGLPAGTRALRLDGVAGNCTVVSPPGSAVIAAGATTTLTLTITCTGPLRDAIVFAGYTSPATQVFVVNADGSGLEQLTRGDDPHSPKAVSPDGMKILFQTVPPSGSLAGLYVMNNDGSNVHPVVVSGARISGVAWGANGRIYFAQPVADGLWPELCSVLPDGSDRTCASPEGNQIFSAPFSLSPDGMRVVFAIGSLVVMNVDGTNFHALPPVNMAVGNPSWSPDGQRIAFEGAVDADGDGLEDRDVYSMKLDGTDLRRLMPEPLVAHTAPRWSPDGQHILFVRTPPGHSTQLMVMPADGSNFGALVPNPPPELGIGSEDGGEWSPVQ